MSVGAECEGVPSKSYVGAEDAEPDLMLAARRALAPAALLLQHFQAPLLTVATHGSQRSSRTRLVLWTDDLRIGGEIGERVSSQPELRDALALLRAAGRDLYGALSRRWPPNAVPRVIGVITDGTGIAVSAGHPSALTQAWLLDHLARIAPASVLIPFRPQGPWALLGPSAPLAPRRTVPFDERFILQ